jgi:CBS domain-containing protein
LRVAEIMTSRVHTVRDVDSLDRVAAVLADNNISTAPVLDRNGIVVGVISVADLLRYRTATLDKTSTVIAGGAINKPVVSVPPYADVAEAAAAMLCHRVKCLPVMDGTRLVGIIDRHDLLHVLTNSDANLRREIQHRLDLYAGGQHRWIVQTADRIAYVTGEFIDEAERRSITMLAASVPGVRDVLLRAPQGERTDCG